MRHFQAAGADGSSVAQPQRAGSGVGTRPPSPSFHDRNASARLPTLAACEPSEKEGEFLWTINAATIDTAISIDHRIAGATVSADRAKAEDRAIARMQIAAYSIMPATRAVPGWATRKRRRAAEAP